MSSGEALRSTPSVSYGSFTAACARRNIRRTCRWLDRGTACVGPSVIRSAALRFDREHLARSIVGAGRSKIRNAHRDCNVRFGSKADMARCQADVRFTPEKRTFMCMRSLLFTGGGKPHQEPHCIAPKPPPWQLSDIQECFPGPRRRLGKAALRLYQTCAQCCAPMQHIFQKVLLFGGMRACCLPALAHRCIVFEVLCRRLLRLQFCFLPEQHCSERQKLAWQQREGTPE